MLFFTGACLLFMCGSLPEVSGRLFIYVILASHTAYYAGYRLCTDWVELYNDGSSAVGLSGYCLTDDKTAPGKWVIPSEISIPEGG